MTDNKPGNVGLWERKCEIRGKLAVGAFPAVSCGHLRKGKKKKKLGGTQNMKEE